VRLSCCGAGEFSGELIKCRFECKAEEEAGEGITLLHALGRGEGKDMREGIVLGGRPNRGRDSKERCFC
jgi:hypothetical protein